MACRRERLRASHRPVGIRFAADDKKDKAKGAVVAQTHYAVTRLAPPKLLSHQFILMIHSSLSLVSIQDCQILACASAHARSAPENSFLICVLYTHVIQMLRQSCSRQCSSLVIARPDNDIIFCAEKGLAQQQRTRPNLASTLLEKILNRSCIASLIIANRQGPSGKILYSVDRRFIRPHVDLQKEPSKLLSPTKKKKKNCSPRNKIDDGC